MADSPSVTGVFHFTVGGATVDVPVGACSPVITVSPGMVSVTEAERAGIAVSGIQTYPAARLVSSDLPTRTAQVQVVAGDESTQTTVTFNNRAELAILKICKVAGPGVAVGTDVTFSAGALSVVVPAGPPPGGTCVVVGWFPVATNVAITESIPDGTEVSAITVAPAGRMVGSPNLAGGSVVARIGSGVVEATFTNQVPPVPSTTTTSTTIAVTGATTTTAANAVSTTAPPGATTTTVTGGPTTTSPGAATTTTAPGGATSTTVGGGPTTTTTSPGFGVTTTLPGGSGPTTTMGSGGGVTTTVGSAVTTTSPPGGGGSTTTSPPGAGVTTTVAASGFTTTTTAGPPSGVTTTTNLARPPGVTTTTNPCYVPSSTTTAPGGPSSTTTVAGSPSTTTTGTGAPATTTTVAGSPSTTTTGAGSPSTTSSPGGLPSPTTAAAGRPDHNAGRMPDRRPWNSAGDGRRRPGPGPVAGTVGELATTGRRIGSLVMIGCLAPVLGGLLVHAGPVRPGPRPGRGWPGRSGATRPGADHLPADPSAPTRVGPTARTRPVPTTRPTPPTPTRSPP